MSLFILWRDTTSELWTPVQFLLHCYYYLLLLALFTFSHITIAFHSIRSILCLQQTGEIDNLIVSWEKSSWLCCVQIPCCCWCKGKTWTRCLINCPELSWSYQASPSEVWLFPTGSINLGFLLREDLLLCSSYFPLGVPNWVVICQHQSFTSSTPHHHAVMNLVASCTLIIPIMPVSMDIAD
jgi:hypothetical protein